MRSRHGLGKGEGVVGHPLVAERVREKTARCLEDRWVPPARAWTSAAEPFRRKLHRDGRHPPRRTTRMPSLFAPASGASMVVPVASVARFYALLPHALDGYTRLNRASMLPSRGTGVFRACAPTA